MKLGKTPEKPSMRMGPSLGNYALDIPAAQDSSAYATFLAAKANEQVLIAEQRVTVLEPPTIVPQPVTSLDYSSFPSVEDKDAVFTVTPVVRLKSGDNVADQNGGTLTALDVTYRPFMDNAWTGAVGTVVGTFNAPGAGAYNTPAWEAAVTEWGAHSRIVLSFDFDSLTDWYIPSVDELSEIYTNLASFPNLTQAITDTLLTVACSSSEAASPNDDTDVKTVDMTDGTVANALKLNQTTVQAGGSQGAIIPVRAQNHDTVVSVGDAGEALDTVVFYVDLCLQNGFSDSAGTAVGTGDLIGDGPANQTAWTTAVTEPLAQCNIVDGLTFGSKNDWFIPSHDELIEIYNNLASFPTLDAAVTAAELDVVCSSSEADAPDDDTELKTVEFSTGVTVNTVNKLTLADVDAGTPQGAVIPVRAIDNSVGVFVVGDAGPGGGIVFYDAGSQQTWGRYMEAVDGWWRALEALDSVDGAWHYDLTEYLSFDADERFYPAGALNFYPYDASGNWRVYPTAGICTFSDVGIASTLWFVEEMVLNMQARTVSSSLQGPLRKVVVSGLVAP